MGQLASLAMVSILYTYMTYHAVKYLLNLLLCCYLFAGKLQIPTASGSNLVLLFR